MTFRPKSYDEAREFLMGRKFKDRTWRAISRQDREIRDQITALTGDPADIEAGTCEIAFRQYSTDIVVFHPDRVHAEVNAFPSRSTNDRLSDMGMPTLAEVTYSNYGMAAHLLCQRERLVGPMGRGYRDTYPIGVPGSHVVLIRTDAGWMPDEDHPRNYLMEDLRVPKPGLRRQFSKSKRALRRCLKTYVDMVESLHGEIDTRPYYVFREALSLKDDAVEDMLAGRSKQSWQQWMNTAPEEHGPAVLCSLYALLESATFWTEADERHFDHNKLPTRAVGDRLNEYVRDL